MLAAEIRKRRVADMRGYPHWRWHLDEVFVKITASSIIFGAPSTHESEVLEAVVTATRDKVGR
jgi:putative transposase